jgi:hypothetical protein
MNRAGEKVIAIANSDDKHQITAVFAATMMGEYSPPQVIYKGKTVRCHPKVDAPKGWDIRHSHNHWSNEETMKRYIEKKIVPFISQKRKSLDNIIAVQVPAHCTDKLQPMDISINESGEEKVSILLKYTKANFDHHN